MSEGDFKQRQHEEFSWVGEAARREVHLARVLGATVWLSWGLLALLVLLWVAAWLTGMLWLSGELGLSTRALNSAQLAFYTGLKVRSHIDAGQWWRLITSTFVHLDIMHIAFNGYGLYSLGPLIERFYGRWRFVVIYLGSGLLASLSSYVFSAVPAGGASGAIYGLVGAMMVVGYKYRELLPAQIARSLTVGMLPWVIFGIGIGFIGSIPMDNAAHIGGLVSGAVIALLMRSRLAVGPPKAWGELGVKGLAVALLLATAVSFAAWSSQARECLGSKASFVACYPELTVAVEPKQVVARDR